MAAAAGTCRQPGCPAAAALCNPDIYPLIRKRLQTMDSVALRSTCRGAFAAFAAGVEIVDLDRGSKAWVKLLLCYGAQPKLLRLGRLRAQTDSPEEEVEAPSTQ